MLVRTGAVDWAFPSVLCYNNGPAFEAIGIFSAPAGLLTCTYNH